MKILITTDLFTTETNGVVTSVKNLYNELLERGHDVKILTLSADNKTHKEGNVYYIKSSSLGIVYPNVRMTLSVRNALVKELILWEPDVIHSNCEFFTFRIAQYIHKKTGAPIAHTYHTMYEDYVQYIFLGKGIGKWVVKTLSRQFMGKVDAVITPTKKVEQTLKGYDIKTDMYIIPTGINLSQHKERITADERREKRAALGISESAKVIVNLGRLGAEKNISELIDFYAEALKTYPELVFLIVGGGPAEEELKTHAKKAGVGDRVIFAGMVKPTEVHHYYQLGDIFVSASTSETQGLTYAEAAANGLPLLCREDLCLYGIVEQGENGYAYKTKEEFLEFLGKMLADEEWLLKAADLSVALSAKYDKIEFVNSVEDVYARIIAAAKEEAEKAKSKKNKKTKPTESEA